MVVREEEEEVEEVEDGSEDCESERGPGIVSF